MYQKHTVTVEAYHIEDDLVHFDILPAHLVHCWEVDSLNVYSEDLYHGSIVYYRS